MAAPEIELIQFAYSHFNEKARWALDFKKVPHRRTSLLPGPHARTVTKLTGQELVPVVRFADAVVADSARIIDELERRYPDPPLYPADEADKKRALEIQAWFDDEVGPCVRRSLFAVMVDHPGYLVSLFGGHKNAPTRMLYRASFPIAAGMIRKAMNIDDPEAVAAALEKTFEALEFVAKESAETGYLVGDRFSVADLAACALLAPASNPPGSPMERFEPMPEAIREWTAQFADSAGVAWVHERYRTDRPESSAYGTLLRGGATREP